MLEAAPGTSGSTEPSRTTPEFPSLLEVVLRVFGCLAVTMFGTAYYAAYEATPEGSGRTFMVGLGLFVVPALWFLGELLGSPLIDLLDSRRWWVEARLRTTHCTGPLGSSPAVRVHGCNVLALPRVVRCSRMVGEPRMGRAASAGCPT